MLGLALRMGQFSASILTLEGRGAIAKSSQAEARQTNRKEDQC
jgi:hypothetical protein